MEVAEGLREWSGLGNAEIRGVRAADVTLKAKRPQFAALSNAKLSRTVPVPTWQDALRRYLTRD